MNKQQKQAIRNSVSQLVEVANRKINVIRLNTHNSWKHEKKKCKGCYELQLANKHYIVEAKFTKGRGIADILNLDEGKVVEILQSETLKQAKKKTKKYPEELKITYVSCNH